jgi:carbonic anhydrase/acetyltransferase-like protein (isoleucine patch superfamily)
MPTPADAPPGLLQRAVWAAEEELGERNPKLWLVLKLIGWLPPFTFSRSRMRLLRLVGVPIGDDTVVCGRISISGAPHAERSLHIGRDCLINEGCRFETGAPITVGDRVYIGHDVTVLTTTHEIGSHHQRCHGRLTAPVVIGDGVWIGTRAVVLPGVEIGDGAVVAAGAVVAESVAADTLVGGVPARVLRVLP